VEEPDNNNENRNGTTAASPSGSSESNSTSSSSTGVVIGGVGSGLALTVGILVVFLIYRKRRDGVIEHGGGLGNAVRGIDPFMARPETFDLHQRALNSLVRQEQLDRMKDELSSLETQSRLNSGNGGHCATSDSAATQSGTMQSDMVVLQEQVRELQAQILRQEHQPAVIDTSPPVYTV
ncbi:hypothetical protein AAF712_010431, partial [Marasmius tenuissimus]